MASTTLNVNLSSTLQATLNQENVYVWAVVSAGGTIDTSNVYVIQNGASVSDPIPTLAIDLPQPLNGGKIYFIIQSADPTGTTPIPVLTFGSGNTIATESDLNWDSATTNNFRYDSFEVSLLGAAADAGNLTDVNGFGIPMSVSVAYPNGAPTQTRGYAENGAAVFSSISDYSSQLVYKYVGGALDGQYRMAASPATAESHAPNPLPGANATDWNAYVESLGASGAGGIEIAGYFNGGPSVEWQVYNGNNVQYLEYHNPGLYSYTVTWKPDASPSLKGTYVLKPTPSSQIQGTIEISSDDLSNSIYATLGNAKIKNPDGTYYQFSGLSQSGDVVIGPDMSTGANNEWGAFFVKFLTGYIGGYLGGTATPLNPLLGTTPIDLSKNWNFDPTFAFGGKIAAGSPGAVTPWQWDSSYGTGVPYDKYAEIFFNETNSYGNGYSDALMSLFQQGGPLIPVGYTNSSGVQADVSIINITLFDDNEPSSTNQGYTPTVLYNYTAGPYVAPLESTGAPNLSLIFGLGLGQLRVDPEATVTLGFYASTQAGLATFTNVNIPTQQAINLSLGANPLTATSGSSTIVISDPNAAMYAHVGASVTLSGATTFAGIDAAALTGTFTITKMVSATQYEITVSEKATSSASGGGSVAGTALPVLYQTWVFDQSSSTFTPGGGAAPTGDTLQLNGLPYDTGVNWYQLTVSKDGVSRTYNLYAEATANQGLLNPIYTGAGANPASLAIDGLASIPTAPLPVNTQYITSLNISAFQGGTLSMDPALLAQIVDPTIIAANPGVWFTPNAPVLGTLSGTTFTTWSPSTTDATPNSAGGLGNVTDNSLAFGWWGADLSWVGYVAANDLPVPGHTLSGDQGQAIKYYTNKVGGSNIAKISVETGGTSYLVVPVTADIDGKWVTGPQTFGNGTYTAHMTEYLPDGKTQVANESSTLTFTVNAQQLDFVGGTGSYIALDQGGGGTTGNWITLQTANSSLPNGTLLAYATDANGDLIGRDGQVGASLEDSVLARIGSVAFDNGTVMGQGTQSVYLPVGLQLHFAIQTGGNTIEQLPGVVVTGSNSLAVNVSGAFGALNLSATVDNTLSAAAQLAQSQQQYDQAWVYLTQGSTVEVDVTGSAWNLNTIHFVKIDVSSTTGEWSVGGVAYGNTDAFRTAVQQNWDPNFAVSGGRGNFNASTDWAVSKGTGYYAPVLYTESGNIFVIGNGNADGMDHIRIYGQNTFGFEDLLASQGSDFDYNDLVMKIAMA
jgi:hypothetical protein